MKKILIATDFSPAAQKAAEYGVQLAKAFGAKVILASAFRQVPIPVTDTPVIADAIDMQNEVQRQLELESDFLTGGSPATIESLSCAGNTATTILRTARAKGAGLIVVGMKGSGKNIRKLFGSTVTALARKTLIPLLVIPENASFTPPKAIAMADNVTREKDPAIPAIVRELADQFHSTLYKLDQIIDGNPIDLVVTKPHARILPERWFLDSDTRQMIFQTDLPLLIVPDIVYSY